MAAKSTWLQELHHPNACNTAVNWKITSGTCYEKKRQAEITRCLSANPEDELPSVASLTTSDMRNLLSTIHERLLKKTGVRVPFNAGFEAFRAALGELCYWPARSAESDPPLGAQGTVSLCQFLCGVRVHMLTSHCTIRACCSLQ